MNPTDIAIGVAIFVGTAIAAFTTYKNKKVSEASPESSLSIVKGALVDSQSVMALTEALRDFGVVAHEIAALMKAGLTAEQMARFDAIKREMDEDEMRQTIERLRRKEQGR